jgi:integrase
MDLDDLTVHGFRATFKTWASERTSFQNEIAEAALAHIIGDKVEQAYRRGDLFEKRRKLMGTWATFCITTTAQESQGNVTPLRAS